MLRIEVDMFSGRPNPEWILTDTGLTDSILDLVAEREGAIARPGTGFLGLGFREIRVTRLGDDPFSRAVAPREFALASVSVEDLQSSGEFARRIVETMPLDSDVQLMSHALTPLTKELRDLIFGRLQRFLADPPSISILSWPPYNPLRTTVSDPR